ncbi:MAG: hypothetical protein ACRDHZ_11300, partial [Ktedonobacteraceae bacterium]
ELGRWLSPDPAGMGSPYVYVSDNPESDTDPTGKFGILEAAEIVVGVALSCTGVGLAIVVAVAAAEGFVGGFIESGGNFRAGLMGAVSGAAFAAIGGAGIGNVFEKAALDGFAGGVLSEANGGRFSAGFIGGFVGGAASGEINAHIMSGDESAGAIAARTAAAAAAGGSASEISGGSFANGAYAAAFAQLFGDIAQREQANSQNDDAAPLSGDNEQGGATDNPGKGYDLNFLEKETTAWKYSQLHQNYPDRFDIIAHGCNDGQCIHTQRGDLFASKLEFRIQQSAVWQKEHQPIELDACFAGKGSYPIAQQIANYFHVKVYAPVSYGWIHSNGVYSASYGHTWGREAIFYPQSQE